MNKMQKVVGASLVGAMILAPVGTASATMTAANVENFYNMPLTITRISYGYRYIGVIFRKRVKYLNMVVIDPNYTEEYADEHYEEMGLGEVEWGKKIFSGDLGGFPANEERTIMAPSSFRFEDDSFGLIYYALEFVDGGHYEGKISYAPCSEAFAEGGYSKTAYECRIYHNEEKTALSAGVNGGTYMSEYTKAKYTGGDGVLTSYAYRLEPLSEPLTGLPADIKTSEQLGSSMEEEELIASNPAWQELLAGYTESLEEIERLQNALNEQQDASSAEIESLKNEIAEYEAALIAETEKWQAELATREAAWQAQIEQKEAEIAEQEAEFAAAMEEAEAVMEELSRAKAEAVASLEQKISELETAKEVETGALREQLAELEAAKAAEASELRAQLAELEATRVAEIEALQGQLDTLEQAKAAEVAALEGELAELKAAKATEINILQEKLETLERIRVTEVNELKDELAELEKAKAAEVSALEKELAELEALKVTEVAVLNQKLTETEESRVVEVEELSRRLAEISMASEEERKALEARVEELKAKLAVKPTVQNVYVDREVVKEVPVEKDCEIAVATSDGAIDSAGLAEADVEEQAPELEKGTEKPWWILPLVAAAVCGLAYWWLIPEMKHKKKK